LIRSEENRELIEDFLETEERLLAKLEKIPKQCEKPVLKAALKSNKLREELTRNVDCEVVDRIFGEKYQRKSLDVFVKGAKLWNLRIDANCQDILLRPGHICIQSI
jgi:hypothetical protein